MTTAWPAPPQVQEASPARARRAWGKLSHEDRYRKQRRDLTRAAAKLASRHGYQATRVADIVTEAGLSKTTFYEHFDSKEDCFVELYRRVSAAMLREGIAAAEGALEDGAYATVLAVLRAMTGYVAQNPRLADVLRDEVSGSHPVLANERTANHQRITELFVTLARRLGTKMPARELELTMSVMVQGVMAVLPSLRKDRSEFDEHLKAIARLACRGLGMEVV